MIFDPQNVLTSYLENDLDLQNEPNLNLLNDLKSDI